MEEEKPFAPKTGLTFGMGNLQTKSESSVHFSGFSFKPTTTSSSTTSGFTFGTSSTSGATGTSGFSFAVGSSQPTSSSQGEEEEYVPPVAETVEHQEEGSLYSRK